MELIELTTTRFTTDIALSVIPHQYNIPVIFMRTEVTTRRIIEEETMSNPVRISVTMNTATSDKQSDRIASPPIVKYCS